MKTIIEVIQESGQLPPKPKGTAYGIKFLTPDWKTYGGYEWPFPGKWTPDVENFNPRTCTNGGVHVALTMNAAQSGGNAPTTCVVVAYRKAEVGATALGKVKVRRAKTLAVIDLLRAIRTAGKGADLQNAYLQGANLQGAALQGANLQNANLQGAYLQNANLQGADLQGADLQGASLQGAARQGANLRYANLQGADLQGANLRYANLQGANLQGANLRYANLQGAIGLEAQG